MPVPAVLHRVVPEPTRGTSAACPRVIPSGLRGKCRDRCARCVAEVRFGKGVHPQSTQTGQRRAAASTLEHELQAADRAPDLSGHVGHRYRLPAMKVSVTSHSPRCSRMCSTRRGDRFDTVAGSAQFSAGDAGGAGRGGRVERERPSRIGWSDRSGPRPRALRRVHRCASR